MAAGASPAPTDGDQVATIARAISKAEGTDDPNSLGARLNNPGNLKVGDVVTGRVTGIRDFGVFVDIGGADGLIHVSELAWHRVPQPRDVVQVGEEIHDDIREADR